MEGKQSTASKEKENTSLSLILIAVLGILLAAGSYYFINSDDPALLAQDIPDVIPFDQLNKLEQDRWNQKGNLAHKRLSIGIFYFRSISRWIFFVHIFDYLFFIIIDFASNHSFDRHICFQKLFQMH